MNAVSSRLMGFVLAIGLVSAATVGRAEPFPESDLPPELKPWVAWVLHSDPDRTCPVVFGEPMCSWPGHIQLEFEKTSATFELDVMADRDVVVVLPGDAKLWPQEVRVDGKEALVLGADLPYIRVGPGDFRVEGRLLFDEMPQELAVPNDIALLTLTVEGESIPFPKRDEDGTLRLQTASSNVEEDERLDVTVMRKVTDGIPLRVETRLVLRVSGKSREVKLQDALVPGTVPLLVNSGIPARVADDGELILQVRAGTHTVTIDARTETDPASLKSIERALPWPESEIWVWAPDERIRQATVSGLPGVDPSRTSLPDPWRTLSAFLVEPGSELKVTTRRRGQPEPPPNQISLRRTMWMDLKGGGYTVQDTLKGPLSRAWRLDLETDGTLGHVINGGEDQLITENPKNKKPGVEIRDKTLNMLAEWRIDETSSDLPAVGWSEDVQNLRATVHLPPGHTVLFAKGVDNLPGTWWDRWDLWGFFFVLIVSFAVGRLTRPLFGVLTFVALTLSYHETNVPMAVWVSLLAALGLLKVLPEGKLRIVSRICCWGSLIWLAAVLVPFSVQQVRSGLFPQIEVASDWEFMSESSVYRGPPQSDVSYEQQVVDEVNAQLEGLGYLEEDNAGGAAFDPAQKQEIKSKGRAKDQAPQLQVAQQRLDNSLLGPVGGEGSMGLDGRLSSNNRWAANKPGRAGKSYKKSLQQDPKAVIQTGQGIPNWRWTAMNLTWSGPVTKDHRFKLYTISPKVNLALSILRVLLLVVVALAIARELLGSLRKPGGGFKLGRGKKAAAGAAGVILAALTLTPTTAGAGESPPETQLTQLLAKLTEPPECRPDCVSASRLDVEVVDDRLIFRAEVHAAEPTSWSIPGPVKNWVPSAVTVDGRDTRALATRTSGFIHVRLDKGSHEVVAEGPVPPGNTFTIEFQIFPHYVSADAPGFVVEGIGDNGVTEGSIQLSRASTASADRGATFEEGSYPPWLEITRTFDFGIPWLLHTRVRRVSPGGTPVMTRIPLLEGESVTESGVQVEKGEVVVNMARDQYEMAWSSSLTEHTEMKLTAQAGQPWTEIWRLQCSPVWQCAHKGLAPIDNQDSARKEPVFMPWPGESLDITLTRPGGIDGQSVTIDAARMTLSPGVRLVKGELMLMIRSSQGGMQVVTLPKGAKVQTLTVDGKERTFRMQEDALEVNLKPGAQRIEVVWQQPGGIKNLYRVPEVKLGRHSANATVNVNLPGDRWLLLAGGPSWGPAVLFWGFLLTILLGGLILGRIKLSPLKTWQWMLLGLGLTQVPVAVTLVIVGWFIVLSWRSKQPPKNVFLHNAFQIILALWTVVTLGCFVGVVYNGLAVRPDMQVAGAGSTNTSLVWYMDRVTDALPTPWVMSFPILVWKLIMLGWALWLAASIIKWAPWAWRSWSVGTLWRKGPKKPKRVVRAPAPPTQPEPKKPEAPKP